MTTKFRCLAVSLVILFASARTAPAAGIISISPPDGVIQSGEYQLPPTDFSSGKYTLYAGVGKDSGGNIQQLNIGVDTQVLINHALLDPSTKDLQTVFDVFIQGSSANYLAEVSALGDGSGFSTTSTLYVSNGNDPGAGGSFDPSNASYWTLDSTDASKVAGAIGFDVSPGHSSPHLQFEFSALTSPNGILSSHSFISVSLSTHPTPFDPPISSAIFTLNPDGSLDVLPLLGPNGDAILKTPEPSSMALVGLGIIGLACIRFRRRQFASV